MRKNVTLKNSVNFKKYIIISVKRLILSCFMKKNMKTLCEYTECFNKMYH